MTDVFEVIIRDQLRVNVMEPDVDVQICLNVVRWCASLSKLLGSLAHRVWHCFISRRKPTSLHRCPLFLISCFLIVLANQSCDWFNRLFGNLVVVPCLFSSFVKLARCPFSDSCIKPVLIRFIVFRNEICLFMVCRMLRESWSEVSAMHCHCSIGLKLVHIVFIQHMIVFLMRTTLRMGMLRRRVNATEILIGRLLRLLNRWLLLPVRILRLHRTDSKFLY